LILLRYFLRLALFFFAWLVVLLLFQIALILGQMLR
jgi:hypothetical protein